jgi:hypothetical protein
MRLFPPERPDATAAAVFAVLGAAEGVLWPAGLLLLLLRVRVPSWVAAAAATCTCCLLPS